MEPAADDYALLDVGEARRLERFGPYVLDRPAPAAAGVARRDPAAWRLASAQFNPAPGASAGSWSVSAALPASWTIFLAGVPLELRLAPSGQVGVHPEHLEIARWAAGRARNAGGAAGGPAAVLNLFAYTGLATLLLARAGAHVAHVDASRPAVAWARRNAANAGLAAAPIRWLVEDAGRFVAREVRRGRRYAGIVLDPPTYGHGPGGNAWDIERGLADLLEAARPLLAADRWFVACTAHATGLSAAGLRGIVAGAIGVALERTTARELTLESAAGARLPSGAAVLLEVGSPDPAPSAIASAEQRR